MNLGKRLQIRIMLILKMIFGEDTYMIWMILYTIIYIYNLILI